MTGFEAIPKVTTLLSALIERVKDRQTATLVQQVQQFHQQIVSDYLVVQAENADLKKQLSDIHANPLIRKYGILWDSAGTPYCPRCQKSGMRIVWEIHINRQVKSFRCSCADESFVLLDAGQPIQADDAMKLMAK